MSSIIKTALLGLMSNKKTLRDVEQMTQCLNEMASTLVSQPISDTTLDNELRRMGHDYLLGKLVQQTRDVYRSKMLNPVYGRSGMIGIIDTDAGLTSLANADCVNAHGYGYVFGLKGRSLFSQLCSVELSQTRTNSQYGPKSLVC